MITRVRGRRITVVEGRRKARGAQVSCAPARSRQTTAERRASALVAAGITRASGRNADHGPAADVEQALTLALQHAAAAYDAHRPWEARVRAALGALLDLFEKQPKVARLCVIESEHAEPAALALREQTLTVLARRIDDGRGHAPRQPPPHAAQAVLAGAIGAIRARLIQPGPGSMSDLLDPLTSFIVLPYRGAAAARAERMGSGAARSG
jgi:hypothetical protein